MTLFRACLLLLGLLSVVTPTELDGEQYYITPLHEYVEEQAQEFHLLGMSVGCGVTYHDGLLHVDLARIQDGLGQTSTPGDIVVVQSDGGAWMQYLQADATSELSVIQAGSMPFIIAEYFVEVLTRDQTIAFFREARRLLQPGGVLRVSTPNLRLFTSAYFDPDRELFGRLVGVEPFANFTTNMATSPAVIFNHLFRTQNRRMIYDFTELKFVASLGGFGSPECSIAACSFGTGVLGRYDSATHKDESLYVELKCQ